MWCGLGPVRSLAMVYSGFRDPIDLLVNRILPACRAMTPT